MGDLLQDPVFFWLMWAMFVVVGIILGWNLRANTSEKEVRNVLSRIEQEKNTLARLYTHIKHQHDLREADFRRASLELSNLHAQIQWYENERATRLPDAEVAEARIERAEAQAGQFAQKLSAMELLADNLRKKNTDLTRQLEQAQQELGAWETLYRDFKTMQERLNAFEHISRSLETERDLLKYQLEAAKSEIDGLQRELTLTISLMERQSQSRTSARKGGRAAPEHTDDLKIIKGISAVFEQKLISLGVHTFEQISRWDDDAVIAFARALGISPGRLFQEDWVGQARYLLGEK